MTIERALTGLTKSSTAATYVEDVFSTYLYTGTGASQTINNGIDLETKGGLVWIKDRVYANTHILTDTSRGTTKQLWTNTTDGQQTTSDLITSFGSTGFTLGVDAVGYLNYNGSRYASWTFRKQAKFFDVQTKSHTNGTASTVDLSGLGTVGMVIVKRTDSTSGWYTWHRSLTASNNILLNTTAAQTTTNAYLSVSGTTLTLSSSTPTGTYVIYAYAHDAGGFGAAGTDSVVSCGSFSGLGQVNLGWEPQYLMFKRADAAEDWWMLDNMRGWSLTATPPLRANASNAEGNFGSDVLYPTATGFYNNTWSTGTYIYLAIRRGPMKTPTDATKVFAPVTYSGNNGSQTLNVGFPLDLVLHSTRNATNGTWAYDRLRNNQRLITSSTAAEAGAGLFNFDGQNTTTVAGNVSGYNLSSENYIGHYFKRAPGFFDVVCYTGTGSARTVAHNLGVAPELMIVKGRSGASSWWVYSAALGATKDLRLNVTDAFGYSGPWYDTSPSASSFSVNTNYANASGGTYVAYLFASCPGVSKVFSFTGNGSSQTIDCGFAAGARFVLIKRTDSTGDWWVYDSARGIVSANDPALRLNSTAAEVTSADAVDPASSGFIVNQEATCNINVNSATYIGLAIA